MKMTQESYQVELEVPEGVQAFNFWTLAIMGRLWEEFPRLLYFNSSPRGVSVTNDHRVAGVPFGLTGPDQVQLFTNTLSWLLAEEYARGTANAAGAFAAVTLTAKGFSILNQVPNSVATKPEIAAEKPLGTLMKEAAVSAVASQSIGMVATLVKAMLQSPGH